MEAQVRSVPKKDRSKAPSEAKPAPVVSEASTPGLVVLQPGQVIQNYEIMKPLGKGKFSIVYMAKHLPDGLMCAVKKINIFDMMVPKQREKCLKEVRLLQSLDHPNIVKLLDSFIDHQELLIIVEWAEKGDLKRLIRKAIANETSFQESEIWEYSKQLASALDHMHTKRIMHRDLKPANIFVAVDGSLKLGDLGLGRFFSSQTLEAFSKVGTPLYMSPEVLHGAGYDMRSDVWSLGCVVYELAMLRSPFKSDQQLSLYDLFVRISKGEYPPPPDTFGAELRKLVSEMLALDPQQRLDVSRVLQVCNAQVEALKASKQSSAASSSDHRPSPLLVMDDIVEKLKLLDCEEFLLRPCGFPNLNRCFFIQPMKLPGNLTQFHVMHTLLSWLLGMLRERRDRQSLADASAGPFVNASATAAAIGRKLALSVRADINNDIGAGDAAAGGGRKQAPFVSLEGIQVTLLQELVVSLQQHGLVASTSQLRAGAGEDVCLVVNALINEELLARDFHFETPSWAEPKTAEDFCEEVVESDLEMSLDTDESSCHDGDASPLNNHRLARDEFIEMPGGPEPIEDAPEIDLVRWKQELERVSVQLGQSSLQSALEGQTSDWRIALRSASGLQSQIQIALSGEPRPAENIKKQRPPPQPPPEIVRKTSPKPSQGTAGTTGREGAYIDWLDKALNHYSESLRQDLTRIQTHEERLNTFRAAKTEDDNSICSKRAVDELHDELAELRHKIDLKSQELASLDEALESAKEEVAKKLEEIECDGRNRLPRLRKSIQLLQVEGNELSVRVGALQSQLLMRSVPNKTIT